ncbi:MAG: formate dehydrogenase accessory sulfurtransferase FdhD [Opitutales bacterium]
MEPSARRGIIRLQHGTAPVRKDDEIATEEPLEIRVAGRSLAVVMRTPGHDRELATGFLLTEGLVRSRDEIMDLIFCGPPAAADGPASVIDVLLTHPEDIDFSRFSRHVFSSSSCGICGKATIEAVQQQFPPFGGDITVSAESILTLPQKLSAAQPTFQRTGGLHASALFDENGNLLLLREDVGRHNALDKVIGNALLDEHLPLDRHILLVSGRVSFEIMQKALAAGVGIVAAISAPTTLAIDFAQAGNQTLIGFVRGNRMNVYAGHERLADP